MNYLRFSPQTNEQQPPLQFTYDIPIHDLQSVSLWESSNSMRERESLYSMGQTLHVHIQ